MDLNHDRVPVLAAFENQDGDWEVWCEHCATWHTHGAAEGLRVAHCSDTRTWIDENDDLREEAKPHWDDYVITLHHPQAGIKLRSQRPNLAPLDWRIFE